MIKYVGTHITLDNVELEKLLEEGYSHITEQGYALSDDEEISTDDIVIEDTLCCLYDSMEENHFFNIFGLTTRQIIEIERNGGFTNDDLY